MGGLPSGRCAQLVNNNLEPGFSDKELHFLVIGLVGMVPFLLIHPVVIFLTRRGWELAVSWLYTMTLIIVLMRLARRSPPRAPWISRTLSLELEAFWQALPSFLY